VLIYNEQRRSFRAAGSVCQNIKRNTFHPSAKLLQEGHPDRATSLPLTKQSIAKLESMVSQLYTGKRKEMSVGAPA